MPVGVVLLARVKRIPPLATLWVWRDRMVEELALNLEDDFYGDGPLIIVKDQTEGLIPTQAKTDPRDCWINVNLLKAYYGPGYERGNLVLFITCARWLEANLSDCEVWYGHDIGDESLHLFDESSRNKFLAYYHQVGHTPYGQKDEALKQQLRALWND